MTIAIGELQLDTARPDDLDEQLVVATGCNARELAAQLRRQAVGHQVARALAPFLPAPVDTAALAAAIDAAEDAGIAIAVAALLDPTHEAEA